MAALAHPTGPHICLRGRRSAHSAAVGNFSLLPGVPLHLRRSAAGGRTSCFRM